MTQVANRVLHNCSQHSIVFIIIYFIRVNVAGSSFMVSAVFEHMKSYSRTENCSVVNISSISAHQTQPNRCLTTYHLFRGSVKK